MAMNSPMEIWKFSGSFVTVFPPCPLDFPSQSWSLADHTVSKVTRESHFNYAALKLWVKLKTRHNIFWDSFLPLECLCVTLLHWLVRPYLCFGQAQPKIWAYITAIPTIVKWPLFNVGEVCTGER